MQSTTRLVGAMLSCAALPMCEGVAQTEPAAYVYRVVGADTLRAFVFTSAHTPAAMPRPGIALFHGGGWTAGSADWTFGAAERFAALGLVAISVQYRLVANRLTPQDAFEDVCAFFRWVRSNRDELSMSDRVAGYGVSAGGHLVAATVTVGCAATGSGQRTRGPDALLLWSPALDVERDGWFVSLMGGRDAARALSPAAHIGGMTPPTSIVHGERDTLTPLRGTEAFCAGLTALGTRCELHAYPGLGHLLTRRLANQESDFDPDPAAVADGIAKHVAFLRSEAFIPAARP